VADKKSEIDRIFIEMFQQFKHRVYGYSRKMVGDKDIAADITQDVFIGYYHCVTRGEIISSPQAWLLVAARNRCLNAIRNQRKNVPLAKASTLSGESSPDDRLKSENLNKAMLQLDPAQREALILKEYEGLSYNEIAKLMRLTIPAIRSLLYRGRIALRECYLEISK
jgi:RNA polymerase sigma-70 factor, ECF subfamily